jgi:hypothetical protein
MSPAVFLEVVETDEGEIVLRRTDSSPGNPEPLVLIRFSGETRALLGDNVAAIARAMINAGVQMTTDLYGEQGLTVAEVDKPQLH